MLFSYSALGYQDNWLHETILEMLQGDFDRIDHGLQQTGWPACVPVARREELKSRRGLRDRRLALLAAYQALNTADRASLKMAVAEQNALPTLFANDIPCRSLDELPEAARQPIKSFFESAFELLSKLGLRDANYKRLYDELDHKVCAYCGVERLDAPGQKREPLDHYLPVATYPFAGVNFRNLSPMGDKCNSRYKNRQNILIDPASGSRRFCNDPYDGPSLTLSLIESEPFAGNRVNAGICPRWVIQWDGGDPHKLATWEAVFAIESRYVSSSLDPSFRGWIDHFCQWSARRPGSTANRQALRQCLRDFAETVVPDGLSDSAFLKRATMLMLAHRCDNTNRGDRVFDWLQGQIDENRLLAA